jgi:hypothetical protein
MTSFKCTRKALVVEFEQWLFNRGYALDGQSLAARRVVQLRRSRLRRAPAQKGIGGLTLQRQSLKILLGEALASKFGCGTVDALGSIYFPGEQAALESALPSTESIRAMLHVIQSLQVQTWRPSRDRRTNKGPN